MPKLVAGCWLLVAGYWLLVSGYWLLVTGCWLLVAGCWLLVAGRQVLVFKLNWFDLRKLSHPFCNRTVTYSVYEITYMSLMEFNRPGGLLALYLNFFSNSKTNDHEMSPKNFQGE